MSKENEKPIEPRKTIGMHGGIMRDCTLQDLHLEGYETAFKVETMINTKIINLTARSPEALRLLASIRDSISASTSTNQEAKSNITAALDEVEKADKSTFLVKYTSFVDLVKNHVELFQKIQPWVTSLGGMLLRSE
ncbi:hypothetical protein [Erwinia persicina]|uniref:hypothetical protein n=1 Tax=Erwinia persicina TaxID=55211 RepID=UPI0017835B46|nr:hypothetical protein [Erwinia persicina]MBD8163301.1 hypothetical protein [Erwinia persicina]